MSTRLSPEVIASGAVSRLAGSAISVVSGVVTSALAVRLLGVADYGILAFALSALAITNGVIGVGIGNGITRAVAASGVERPGAETTSLVQAAFALVGMLTGVGMAFVAILVVLQSSAPFPTQLAVATGSAALLLGSSVVRVSSSVARGLGRVVFMELPGVALALGRVSVLIAFFATDRANLAYVSLGLGGAGMAAGLYSWTLSRRLLHSPIRIGNVSKQETKKVARTLFPFILFTLALLLSHRLSVLVLGFTAPSSELGAFEPILRINEQLIGLVPAFMAIGYLPVATSLLKSSDITPFRDLYATLSRLIYVFTFPAILVLAVFPETVFSIVYGSSFPVRPELVRLVLIGFAVNIAVGVNGNALMATGDSRLISAAAAYLLAMAFPLALVLVPLFGDSGAAAVVAASLVIQNVIVGVAIYRRTGAHPIQPKTLVAFVSSALPIAAGVLVKEHVGPDDAIPVTIWCIGIWATWMAALWTVRVVGADDLKLLVPKRRARPSSS